MNTTEIKSKLAPIFEKHKVVLGYLFGSHAHGRVTPLSDVDIAVVFSDKVSKDEQFDVLLRLIGDVMSALKTNEVDVVNIDSVHDPLFKHQVIFGGKVIFSHNADKAQRELERTVFREYDDTSHIRAIASRILHQQAKTGTFGTARRYVTA